MTVIVNVFLGFNATGTGTHHFRIKLTRRKSGRVTSNCDNEKIIIHAC